MASSNTVLSSSRYAPLLLAFTLAPCLCLHSIFRFHFAHLHPSIHAHPAAVPRASMPWTSRRSLLPRCKRWRSTTRWCAFLRELRSRCELVQLLIIFCNSPLINLFIASPCCTCSNVHVRSSFSS